MISWRDYLSIFVEGIREAYEVELSRDGLKPQVLEECDPFIKRLVFVKPCQIDVFEFSAVGKVLWIVRNDKNKPDMEFKIVEGIEKSPTDFMATHEKYVKYHEAFDFAEWTQEDFGEFFFKETPNIIAIKHYDGMLFFSNPKDTNPKDLVLKMFYRYRTIVLRSIQRFRIEDSMSKIVKEVKGIKETEVSAPILNALTSIEVSLGKLKKIDEHEQKLMSMKNEIVGVRKLIGTKTFGEWKVLLSEIDKMNTRIDALSDIKGAYDKVLAQQNAFMKQQSEVMKQQSSFIKWVKYATILVPIAVVSVPVIEILLRHFLGTS